jgi:hypothetical protein
MLTRPYMKKAPPGTGVAQSSAEVVRLRVSGNSHEFRYNDALVIHAQIDAWPDEAHRIDADRFAQGIAAPVLGFHHDAGIELMSVAATRAFDATVNFHDRKVVVARWRYESVAALPIAAEDTPACATD